MVFNLTVTKLITASVETQSREVLMVVLPIVGITVVLLSLALLAVILKQFVFIDGWKELFSKKQPAAQPKKVETAPLKKEENDEEDDESVMTAIATAIFLYQNSIDRIALTEIPLERSEWTISSRTRQTGGFIKWQSKKMR